MKKLACIAALSLVSNVVLAADVGAPNPQLVNIAPTNIAIFVVETGVSTSWAKLPEEAMATDRQIEDLNIQVEALNAKLQKDLDAIIAKKFEPLAVF